MSRTCTFFAAAAAVVLLSAGAYAADNVLLALNKPSKPEVNSLAAGLKEQATAQISADAVGTTDFDAFSAVNDPLYREGSKEMLQQEARQDAAVPAQAKAQLRDAPADTKASAKRAAPSALPSKVSPAAKKALKPVRTDPLKTKNSL